MRQARASSAGRVVLRRMHALAQRTEEDEEEEVDLL